MAYKRNMDLCYVLYLIPLTTLHGVQTRWLKRKIEEEGFYYLEPV